MTWDAVAALLGCFLVARLAVPERAEGLRIGFFAALMAFVFVDSARRGQKRADATSAPVAIPVVADEPVDLRSQDADDRLSAIDVLTDFSLLRHLRRTGAVSDSEFEAKKVDILRRV